MSDRIDDNNVISLKSMTTEKNEDVKCITARYFFFLKCDTMRCYGDTCVNKRQNSGEINIALKCKYIV